MKEPIRYFLKRNSRGGNLRLAIHPDGRLVVSAPAFLGKERIEKFLREKTTWIRENLEKVKAEKSRFGPGGQRKEYLLLKNQARRVAREKAQKYARLGGFVFNRISIRNQRTRWGSCSQKGNLNFNYKIALLPEELAEYIVVHELCHLKEFNHSPAFWRLVGELLPDYKNRRRRIKKM